MWLTALPQNPEGAPFGGLEGDSCWQNEQSGSGPVRNWHRGCCVGAAERVRLVASTGHLHDAWLLFHVLRQPNQAE